MPSIYALLIAIDEYPNPQHRLSGCVNDLNSFKSYLEKNADTNQFDRTHIKTLINSEANRKNVIEAFDIFSQAAAGDVCVLHYCGHGSQSPAAKEFWHLAPDHMNDSIVCWDSRSEDGRDLMDKELSYLIWKATKKVDLQFVVIMDCCHSGSKIHAPGMTVRMAEPATGLVPAEDYLGYTDYKKTKGDNRIEVIPPRGKYIYLAAAKNPETAKELQIDGVSRGIFTYSLLETLQESGNLLSYRELISRTSIKIQHRGAQQSPQAEASKSGDLRLPFLGGIKTDVKVGSEKWEAGSREEMEGMEEMKPKESESYPGDDLEIDNESKSVMEEEDMESEESASAPEEDYFESGEFKDVSPVEDIIVEDDSEVSGGVDSPGGIPIIFPPAASVSPSPAPDSTKKEGELPGSIQAIRKGDEVDCSVYAPPQGSVGDDLFIQVWLHLPDQKSAAETKAKEFDADAVERAFQSLSLPIEKGDELTLVLTTKGVELDETTQSIKWNGSLQSAQFIASIPDDYSKSNAIFTLRVFKEDIPIGHLKFIIKIAPKASTSPPKPQPLGTEARRYKKAFISYASKDRNEVLKRVQMLDKLGITFFQDLISLNPGERWEKMLYKNIDDSDLFLLFWSTAAKESKWVLKELQYAINLKHNDDDHTPVIQPVPIEGPPIVYPPEELGHMHFNDRILYFIVPEK